jgi:hypothetical protein
MNSTRISINVYLRLSFGSSCWKHVLGSGSKRLDAPFSAGTTQKWQVLRTPHAVWGKTRSAWWYRGEQLAQSVSAKLITRYRVSDWPEYQRFICWVIGACRLPRWPPIGQPQPGSGSLKLPSATHRFPIAATQFRGLEKHILYFGKIWNSVSGIWW